MIGEYASTGTLLRRYVHGPAADEPLVWYEGADTSDPRWLVADDKGSVIAVTDATGTARATNTYDEYGMPGVSNQGRFQYTGQAWAPEVELYNYKARFYSPTLGRFMQPDPIGYGDGLNLTPTCTTTDQQTDATALNSFLTKLKRSLSVALPVKRLRRENGRFRHCWTVLRSREWTPCERA